MDCIRNYCNKIWLIQTQIAMQMLWTNRNNIIHKQEYMTEIKQWIVIMHRIKRDMEAFYQYEEARRNVKGMKIIRIFVQIPAFKSGNARKNSQINHVGWFDGGMRSKTDASASGSLIIDKRTGNIIKPFA